MGVSEDKRLKLEGPSTFKSTQIQYGQYGTYFTSLQTTHVRSLERCRVRASDGAGLWLAAMLGTEHHREAARPLRLSPHPCRVFLQ